MSAAQQQVLFENTAHFIGDAPSAIQQLRHLRIRLQGDPAYGRGVSDALGIPPGEVG